MLTGPMKADPFSAFVAVMDVADGVGAVPELLRQDERNGMQLITKVSSQERILFRSLFLFINVTYPQ
jgi:hypothetical protein